jgi:hypothetical protein
VGSCNDAAKEDEGKKIVAELAKLKYEVQHDRALTCVPIRGQEDTVGYAET